MIKFIKNNIWYVESPTMEHGTLLQPGFYFEDETNNIGHDTPYATYEEAQAAMNIYAENL